MSEITTIWNQLDMPQDISEVWRPSEADGVEFLQENREPGCYPKHVIIENHIGYMIMPGIYCFGRCYHSGFRPVILENWSEIFRCARKSAVLGYYLSDGHIVSIPCGFALLYLAIDQENIDILKKMQRTLEDYVVLDSEALKTTLTFFESVQKTLKKNFEQPLIENTAEELMQGLGIRDIRVGWKCVFSPRIPVKKYMYAYKSSDKLILIPYDKSDISREEYDLCVLEELTVRKTEALHCGILIDRDYFLIDCNTQKAKQVLTPEAFELFRKNKLCGLGESNT